MVWRIIFRSREALSRGESYGVQERSSFPGRSDAAGLGAQRHPCIGLSHVDGSELNAFDRIDLVCFFYQLYTTSNPFASTASHQVVAEC